MSTTQLSVEADLTIENGDDQITVRGNGSGLIVEVPDVGSAFRLVRFVRASGLSKARGDSIIRLLTQVGISVTIRTPARRLMTIGGEKSSNLLRLIGLPGISLHAR